MVSTSKVLTVSYGTFSCTLEGFDDSFDTMKAIAEYFRDLAADDRYFGAEPPTPDAEMLARIAEREVSRHVEARNEDGNIVLRTALPAAGAIVSDDTPTDARTESAHVENERAEQAAREAEKARVAEDERRREEERVAAQVLAQQEADALKAAETQAALEAQIEAAREAQAAADAQAEADAAVEKSAQDVLEADTNESASQESDTPSEPEADDDGDSIADKLARIRAVVGQPSDAPARSDFSEDEHADDIMQGKPGDTDLEDILDLSDSDVPAEEASEDTVANDTIAGVMARVSSDTDTSGDSAQSEAREAPLELSATDLIEDAQPAEVSDEAAEVAPAAPARPVRARVIKMKRAEFEAAVASGELEEEPDEDAELLDSALGETAEENVEAAQVPNDSLLSADEEAELQRELAAVEAELAGLDGDAHPTAFDENGEHPVPDYEETIPEYSEASRGADDLNQAPDEELDRLLDQTNTQLDEPDGKKRRSALGHLRAAVASARADKDSGLGEDTVDSAEAYRDDLEVAVRPSRPVRRLSGSDVKPKADVARPPLKLVAEQRVDAPQGQDEAPAPQPVRPRRVRADDPRPAAAPAVEIDAEGGTFMEFAEEMGATELPDLLEAAAAYLAYVEGREQFSRPQLMTKVRMVQEENFSREDGLRSFGQLLRQGKIEKISGGRFTVSDRISFKPDTRAAG